MNSRLLRLAQSELAPLLVGAFSVAFVVASGLLARRLVRSLRARQRAQRALRGERRAGALLMAHGFRVDDAQLSITYHPTLAGEGVAVPLRADYLVSRRGRRYVAEVKTGVRAPSLSHAPTRRQLLEYSVAFDVDGVLLVDVEAGLVQEVLFPMGPARRRRWNLRGLVACVALVTVGAVALGPSLHDVWQRGRTIVHALWSADER